MLIYSLLGDRLFNSLVHFAVRKYYRKVLINNRNLLLTLLEAEKSKNNALESFRSIRNSYLSSRSHISVSPGEDKCCVLT